MTDSFERFRATLAERFRLENEIGRGGMGIVYRARDLRHERDVAIKVLRPEIGAVIGPDRFLREIRIEATLQHPNIVPVLDSGEAAGIAYCVLPYVAGQTLRERLLSGPLPIDEAIGIATDLAEALDHAHRAGFIHRDLKPENVVLSNGHALLLDFGIARAIAIAAGERLTSEGIALGTPAYMSPEQAGGDRTLDARTDIYSLGILLFEMLAGEPPFGGQSAQAIFARHIVETPPPASALRPPVDAGLDWVITKALAKQPVDRFATAAEFAEALKRHSEYVPPPPRRRRRGVLLALALLAVLAIGGVAVRRWIFPPPLDPTRVVVFPVSDRPTPAEPASFSTDVPYAIELALDHTAPLRWVHGWDYLDADLRRDPVSLTGARMRSLVRRVRARYYIDGGIQRQPTGTQLILRLHDAGSDSIIATEGATAGGGAGGGAGAVDLPALAVQAVSKLLLRWLAPGRHSALAALASRRPGAVALQVQGEQEYRQTRFGAALALFERSMALDTTWGYAAVKAALAAGWLGRRNEALRLSHVQTALRHPESLPLQYYEFARGLESYLEGQADSAVGFFRRSIALAPAWEEAHMALGEVYHHLLPSEPEPEAKAQAAFEAALAADSSFAPAARHLAELLFRHGELDRGERLLERIEGRDADSASTRTLSIMRDCLRRRYRDAAWTALAGHDPLSVTGAALQLSAGGAQPPCAERLYRALLRVDGLPESYTWTAVAGLQGLLLTTGRRDEAIQLLDSALQRGVGAVRFLYLLESAEAPELEPRARETATFARTTYGESYANAAPLTRWALSVWHARHHEGALVTRISEGLAASTDPRDRRGVLLRDAVTAHAAAARGDTTRAIGLFQSLRSNAPIDQLTGDLLEPLALERLRLGELLFAKRRYQEAHDAMAAFDHAEIAFLPFITRSLAIRASASRALGDPRAEGYEARLKELARAELIGPRR